MTWKDTVMDFVIRYGFQIIGAIIILTIGAMVARWLGRLTESWLVKHKLELPVRTLTVRVVKLIVFALAAVLALDKVGVQIGPLVAGIGVAGAGIALAMQGMLGNVIAGLTIIFTKPFRVGEYIEILGEHGQVVNIELFSTVLAHVDRSRVVIPNRKIIGEILHNYGAMRQAIMTVGVAYDSDIALVFSTIREVLNNNPRVLKDPAPGMGIASLGDSAININIVAWFALADYGAAQPEIYNTIITRFREKGIEIPFPQRDIRLLNAPASGASAA
jgi:small conductance mechanosensitive channel